MANVLFISIIFTSFVWPINQGAVIHKQLFSNNVTCNFSNGTGDGIFRLSGECSQNNQVVKSKPNASMVNNRTEFLCDSQIDSNCGGNSIACVGAGRALPAAVRTDSGWQPPAECQPNNQQALATAPGVSLEVLVMREFANIQPEIAAPHIQPADTTLVNLATTFYSSTRQQDIPLTLVGQQVTLRIIPTSYIWHFGDGHEMTTRFAGSPYPNSEITHKYRDTGRVQASLAVTFSGAFAVNGTAYRSIDGTVSRTSPTVPLRIREAQSQLVDPQ